MATRTPSDPSALDAATDPVPTRTTTSTDRSAPSRAEPAPTDAAPTDAGLPGTTIPDRAGPDHVEDVPGAGHGGELPGADLLPEVADPLTADDQFGLGERFDVGGAPGTGEWDPTADLERPDVVDLDAGRDPMIDPGYTLDDLVGAGSLDGRTHDAFDSVDTPLGPGDPGQADPDAMTGDGKAGGTNASDLTTEWTGIADSVANFFGFGQEAAATEAADAIAAPPPPGDAGTGDGTAVEGITTPETSYTDGDGVSSTVTAPVDVHPIVQGISDMVNHKKGIDGKATEHQKQMDQVTFDELPPDHPDAVGTPTPRPPGSETDSSIDLSLRLGLGGQRGGDVDPAPDTGGSSYLSDDPVTSYEDVLIDPGDDGFAATPPLSAADLPGADDLAAPYVDDGSDAFG